MRLQDYDHGQRYVATLLANERITPAGGDEVRELGLEVEAPDFRCARLGQSVGVIVPGAATRSGSDAPFPPLQPRRPTASPDASGIAHDHAVRQALQLHRRVQRRASTGRGLELPVRPGSRVTRITINGPFGLPFAVPADPTPDLLLIGMGTGIAPFRAFVKHGLYRDIRDWQRQGAGCSTAR